MPSFELCDIVATRSLFVLDSQGHKIATVAVAIGRPEREPTGEWHCGYEIAGPGFEGTYGSLGIDAVQALEGAILAIGGTLAGTQEAKEGRLRWDGSGRVGLPVLAAQPTHHEASATEEAEDVIAVRKLSLTDKKGHPRPSFRAAWSSRVPKSEQTFEGRPPPERRYATVSIERPAQRPTGEWVCSYRVRALGVESVDGAAGLDSIQALQGALRVIGSSFAATRSFVDRHVCLKLLPALGFPITREPPA